MSQITRTGGGGPVPPTGGVLTISGDGLANPVSPSLTGNIELDGAGGITIVGDPTNNRLTITDTNAAARYYTEDTNYAIPVAGRLIITGGANIFTSSAAIPNNTVTVSLTDNVILAGHLETVEDITTTTGNIVATLGNIRALAGNITAVAGNIDAGGQVSGHSLASGTTAILNGEINGVLITNGAGTVAATKGAVGTVLTGTGLATAPTFQAIPVPANLNFAADMGAGTNPQANTITINGTANQIITTSPAGGAGHLGIAFTPNIVVQNNITSLIGDITARDGAITAVDGDIVLTHGQLILAGNAGVNGQVLTSAGPTATPSWTNIGAAVTVTGTPNQISVSAGPNYVVSLPAAITTPGSLTVTGATTLNAQLTANGNAYLHGATSSIDHLFMGLAADYNGVLQSGGAGSVHATNGNPLHTPGQVLISGDGTHAPQWANLTSPDGSIAFTPGVNSLGLRTVGGGGGFGATAFKACTTTNYSNIATRNIIYFFGTGGGGTGGAPVSTLPFWGGYDGQAPGPSYVYPGNGANAPAYYTAPSNGLYSFSMGAEFGSATGNLVYWWLASFIVNGVNYFSTLLEPYGTNYHYYYAASSQNIYLQAGQQVSCCLNITLTGITTGFTIFNQ